mgnify:CR=1 FL=1
MGTLNNRFQYVWYGTCGEQEKCKPYIFKENPAQLTDAVEMISSFTTTGANNSPLFYKPEEDEGDLASLECGGMYCISLRPGKSLNIPGLTAAGSETIKVGENQLASKISFTCAGVFDATPSPSFVECIPDSFTDFKITSPNQLVSILGADQRFIFFSTNDKIGIDESFFTSALGTQIDIKFPNGVTSQVILTGVQPKQAGGMFYVDRGTGCYGGEYAKESSDTWVVNLKLLSGEDSEPEPQPTPTPEPSIDCNCAPSNFTKVDITGSQVSSGGNMFAGFATGSDVSYNPSTLKTEGIACTIDLSFPNGTTLGMIVLNNKVPDNTQFYVKRGNVCYTATATSSNKGSDGNWSLTTVVSKNLSTACGDSEEVPTPKPVPTPTPKPQPTPTPKPQQSGECCPETTNSYDTNGEFDATQIKMTLPGDSLSTTVADYKGWANGGKLCIDMSNMGDAQDNSTASTERYYILPGLPSGSIPTGTLARQYNNGNNTFYYTDPSGNCYSAEYGDAGSDPSNPVVMTKTS